MADDIKNFAIVDVVGNNQSVSATSIRIEGGHASRLPTAPFNAVWWNWTVYRDYNDDPNVEIVRVTAIDSATDLLTITRAQEGTTASAKSVGGQYKLEAFATARTFEFDVPSEVPTKATGAEVDAGTDDSKFVTAKALTDSAVAYTTDITKTAVGLSNADNTSDTNKPVSTAQQTALNLKKTSYKFVYDFSVLGGAQGTIALTQTNGALPNNLIVQNALIDVITPLGSAGLALIAATTGQSAGDLIAAAAVGGAPWSSAGLKATLVLLGTIATQIKTTATRSPALAVTVADLNAGKLNIFIEGYLST